MIEYPMMRLTCCGNRSSKSALTSCPYCAPSCANSAQFVELQRPGGLLSCLFSSPWFTPCRCRRFACSAVFQQKKAVRRQAEMERKATITLQAAWRGRKSRKTNTKRMKETRARFQEACAAYQVHITHCTLHVTPGLVD